MKSLQKLNDTEALRNLPFMVLFIFFSMIGAIGNSLVIYVFGFKVQKSTKNILILSLAIYDLLLCCVCAPAEFLDMLLPYQYPADWTCKMSRFVTTLIAQGTGLILLLSAVDKHRKACRVFGTQIGKEAMAKLCAGSAFATSCLAWPELALSRTRSEALSGFNATKCLVDENPADTVYLTLYTGLTLSVNFVILSAVLACYVLVLKKIRQRYRFFKRHNQRLNRRGSDGRCSWCWKLGKICQKVVLVTPFFVLRNLSLVSMETLNKVVYFHRSAELNFLRTSAHVWVFHNAAVHPIIHYFFNNDFGTEMSGLLGRLITRNGNDD